MYIETIDSLSKAFLAKMQGASFFYNEIEKLYKPGVLETLPVEFFYYLDAYFFEMHAASQMLLQIIYIKSEVNIKTYQVSWGNEGFRKSLEIKSQELYNFWENIDKSSEFWTLEAYRQHISHRGNSVIQLEKNDEGIINSLSLAIRYRYIYNKETKTKEPKLPPPGGPFELFDVLKSVSKFLEQKFTELCNIK